MRIAKRVGIAFVLGILLALAGQPVNAQNTPPQSFYGNGHVVTGQFYTFFQSAPDPLSHFGYPITDAFRDSTGRLTQYFQRARFDLVMTDKGPQVVLADLGRYLYEDIGATYNIVQDGPPCRSFPTGKTVCYAFLDFYDANQGSTYFGDPISFIEKRDGLYVQYFTKVRLEYDASLPDGHWVSVSKIGRQAFDIIVGNQTIINTTNSDNITIDVQDVTNMTARAFVHSPLVAAGETQTIYLIVQDQKWHSVKGASVSVTVIYPDGQKFLYPLLGSDVTGSDGILTITMTVPRFEPRQVVKVQITAQFQGLTASASTWFRIWY